MSCSINLLLQVERQMIAVLRDDDLREQSWPGKTALLRCVERRNDGHLVRLIAPHILFADGEAAEEPHGFIVDLFDDFITNIPQG